MLERIFDREDLKEKLESRFWWPELAKPGQYLFQVACFLKLVACHLGWPCQRDTESASCKECPRTGDHLLKEPPW